MNGTSMQQSPTSNDSVRMNLEQIELLLKQDPNNRHLLAEAIDISLENSELNRAKAHLEIAMDTFPSDPYFLARSGNIYLAEKKWLPAAEIFSQLRTISNDPSLLHNHAFALFHARLYDEVVRALLPFVRYEDTYDQSIILLLRSLHHLSEFQQATELIDFHESRLSESPEFLSNASIIYFDAGNLEKAKYFSESAFALGQRPLAAIVVGASVALSVSDHMTATTLFNEAITINPKDGRSWSGLGMTSLFRRDLKSAEYELENAVNFIPSHIGTWHLLGWCKLLNGNIDEADLAFKKALELDRNFGESHGSVAITAALKGDVQRAQKEIERAIRLDANSLAAGYAEMIISGKASDKEQFQRLAFDLMSAHSSLNGQNLRERVQDEL
jgi:tetratricopeptide (TPR) repeat protein